MRVNTKAVVVAVLAVAGGLFGPAQAKKVSYTFNAKSSFSVEVPDTWKVTPAKEEGDYADLESTGGTVIQLRTVAMEKEALEDFDKDVNAFVASNYKDVEMKADTKGCTLNGLHCAVSYGTGKEKEGGAPVKLMSGAIMLSDGKVGEIWYVAPAEDTAGISDAATIFNSYKSP